MKKSDVLIVIPARGGSKGIPKKNAQRNAKTQKNKNKLLFQVTIFPHQNKM